MKICLMVISLLLANRASAEDVLRLPGPTKLTYTNQFSYDWMRRNEVVVTLNDIGRARLQELRSQEFSCQYKGRETYLCAKLYTVGLEPDGELKSTVENFFARQEVEFFALSGSPERMVKGDSYVEYSIPQAVKVNSEDYPNYRYAILSGTLHKIVFGNPAKGGLIAHADGSYELIYTMNRTISDHVFEQHTFVGTFR